MKAQDSTLDLKRQLEAYAAATKVPAHNSGSRWRKWSIYAAASGAALAGASAASADIIYSGIQNISFAAYGGIGRVSATRPISLNGNELFFQLQRYDNPLNGHGFPGHFTGTMNAGFRNSGAVFTTGGAGSAKNFAPGELISGAHKAGNALLASGFLNGVGCGPLSAPVCTPGMTAVTTGARGHLFFGGILGVEFNGRTSLGNPTPPEYGWVRVAVADGPTRDVAGIPVTLTIIDWAYNTNGPILAGQTAAAVPEPATLPMMLLAAGAAGVLAWKRRRKAAETASSPATTVTA